MHFCCFELMLITLIKKVILHLWISEEHLCDTILNSKVFSRFENLVLIEKCWDCYQLTGPISNFFRSLVKISRPLSHFEIFIASKEEGVSQLFLRILPKKKIWAIKRSDMLAQGTVLLYLLTKNMFCYDMKLLGKKKLIFIESLSFYFSAFSSVEIVIRQM